MSIIKTVNTLIVDANVSTGFGPGSGTIYGQNLACTGNEQRLSECTYDMDASSCTHANDAGVICSRTRKELCMPLPKKSSDINFLSCMYV